MPKCIYCLEDKNALLFNTEHVIPESFGRFQQNLTLINKVCTKCNQKFGDDIDLELGRNTFEGISRYKHGIKKANKFKNRGKKSNLTMKIAEGPLKNLVVELIPDQTRLKLVILPQIGLRKGDGTYDFFEFKEIPEFQHLSEKYPNSERLILIPPGVNINEATKSLNKKGFKFQYQGEFITSTNDILCEIDGQIDKKIRRAFAKIAFNFFAYFNDEEILFHPTFNEIRDFILNGNVGIPIKIDNKSILADEKSAKSIRAGHIVAISKIHGKCIFAQLSLFNTFRYTILLAKNVNFNKNIQAGFGRFFDVQNMKIHEISSTELIFPSVNLIIPKVKIWIPR